MSVSREYEEGLKTIIQRIPGVPSGVFSDFSVPASLSLRKVLIAASKWITVSDKGVFPLLHGMKEVDGMASVQWNPDAGVSAVAGFIGSLFDETIASMVKPLVFVPPGQCNTVMEALWFRWNSEVFISLADMESRFTGTIRPGDIFSAYLLPLTAFLSRITGAEISADDVRTGKGGRITGFMISTGSAPVWYNPLSEHFTVPDISIRKWFYNRYANFTQNKIMKLGALELIIQQSSCDEAYVWSSRMMSRVRQGMTMFDPLPSSGETIRAALERLSAYCSEMCADTGNYSSMFMPLFVSSVPDKVYENHTDEIHHDILLMNAGALFENGTPPDKIIGILLQSLPESSLKEKLTSVQSEIRDGVNFTSAWKNFFWGEVSDILFALYDTESMARLNSVMFSRINNRIDEEQKKQADNDLDARIRKIAEEVFLKLRKNTDTGFDFGSDKDESWKQAKKQKDKILKELAALDFDASEDGV